MTTYQRADFAGFWLRLLAFIIDIFVVAIIVFPFALIVGLSAPNSILVEVPFGLFTTTTVVAENVEDNSPIERDEVLGLWTNYYQVTETVGETGETYTERTLVEPENYSAIDKTTSSDIEFYVIFIYWILLEASVWQASVGKKVMGIKVVTEDGDRASTFECVARNLLKLPSALILFVGFMMAGWTDKKQALHDMVPNLFVVKGSSNKPIGHEESATL